MKYIQIRRAAIIIQRYFRGIFARENYKTKLDFDFNEKNVKYFANQASIIKR